MKIEFIYDLPRNGAERLIFMRRWAEVFRESWQLN